MSRILAGLIALSLYSVTSPVSAQLINGGGGGSTNPLSVSGFDSGPTWQTATPANSSHAAGVSVGGLFTVPVARTSGGSGINTNFQFVSSGGATIQYLVRIWTTNPTHTTCTDNTAFVESAADDFPSTGGLITNPFPVTPAAPASTQGDSNTYAQSTIVTWDYKTSGNADLYVCIVATATDTADENKPVYVMLSGPQN